MVEAADAVELAVANPQRSVSQADVRPTCKVSPSQRGALFKVITEVGLSGATTKVLTEKVNKRKHARFSQHRTKHK
ncbi:TPA: hypothetical protein ACH3X1_010695 [Trebouxia sp. C0004]